LNTHSSTTVLVGNYDEPLVLVSIVIAILAAGAALDLAARVTSAHGRHRIAWLSGGAVAMGTGIWSMHYIGMLAYHLPVAVLYDWPTVLVSLLAAIFASWVSLFVVSQRTMRWPQVAMGSVLMGGGIASMHYIGMEAMRLPAMCHYNLAMVSLSIALAMAIAFVALRMTFAFRATAGWKSWRKIATAVTMGAAIPSMHYVGMAAVSYTPQPLDMNGLRHAVDISDLGIVSITLITLVILGFVFLTSMVDRRFAVQATALQSSEQRFRLIVETALDAFLQIDPRGVLTDWNVHAERLFGWSRDEAIGKHIDELIVLDQGQGPLIPEDYFARQPTCVQQRIEITARHRSGREFPAEMALSTIRIDQQDLIAAFVHDVSARKLTELEREKAKAAAEAANRSKSEFLANMSHEIRTPMNGVLGMTDLLLDTQLDPQQRQFAETIHGSATALLGILNDILDFSKIEAGKLDVEQIEMDPRRCVEDVAAIMSVQAAAKQLKFVVNVHSAVPERVLGDPHRLRQILLNLCSNAVKFTQRGEVVIEVFALGSHNGQPLLGFEVRDSGIGMSPEVVARLFQPFTQADGSTTRLFGGTGLGLSIVQRLVQLMGGRISVNSVPGKGSNFTFTLCGETPEASTSSKPVLARESAARSPRAQRYQAHILVAEDNRTNQEVVKLFLQRLGCQVTLVPDGAAAVRTCLTQDFDMVLMDVQMPVMDGLAATREIRRQQGLGKHTPIVALTASAMTGERELCLAAGMDSLLTKPLQEANLRETLDKYGFRLDTAPPTALAGMYSPQPHVAPIDIERLRATTGANLPLLKKICRSFVNDSTELADKLAQAVASADRDAFRAVSHKLAGGSTSIYAQRMSAAAAALESGEDKPAAEMDALLREMRAALNECAAYVETNLS
jgi:two-component system sensor histidine kinase/response regulator